MNGIVFQASRAVPADEQVRWVGHLADESYMAAFSDLDREAAIRLAWTMHGTLATVRELPGLPLPPDFPVPDGLKNRVCLAETVIARYPESERMWNYLQHPAVKDLVRGASSTDYGLFVEFGSDSLWWFPKAAPPMALWAARVLSSDDIRTPALV